MPSRYVHALGPRGAKKTSALGADGRATDGASTFLKGNYFDESSREAKTNAQTLPYDRSVLSCQSNVSVGNSRVSRERVTDRPTVPRKGGKERSDEWEDT